MHFFAINQNSKDENINTINAFFTALHKNAILIRAEELRVSSKFDLTQFEAKPSSSTSNAAAF